MQIVEAEKTKGFLHLTKVEIAISDVLKSNLSLKLKPLRQKCIRFCLIQPLLILYPFRSPFTKVREKSFDFHGLFYIKFFAYKRGNGLNKFYFLLNDKVLHF